MNTRRTKQAVKAIDEMGYICPDAESFPGKNKAYSLKALRYNWFGTTLLRFSNGSTALEKQRRRPGNGVCRPKNRENNFRTSRRLQHARSLRKKGMQIREYLENSDNFCSSIVY